MELRPMHLADVARLENPHDQAKVADMAASMRPMVFRFTPHGAGEPVCGVAVTFCRRSASIVNKRRRTHGLTITETLQPRPTRQRTNRLSGLSARREGNPGFANVDY